MKEIIKKIYRPCGKITDFFIIATILSVILDYAGTILTFRIFDSTNFYDHLTKITGNLGISYFMGGYLDFIGIWIVYLFVILIFKSNRPIYRQLTTNKDKRNLKGGLIGLGLGFAFNSFSVIMSIIMGDIKLSFGSFNLGLLLMFFIAVTIQSGAEEIVDRSYLYQKLRRRYRHPAVAVIVNAVIFSASHLFNPGITFIAFIQIFVIGVIFALFVYRYDSLWMAIMFHASWNFTQNLIYGLPNSGMVSEYSLFKLDAASATDGIFYNVNFGVEGSIGSVVILILFMCFLIYTSVKHGEKQDYWADMEKAKLEAKSK